jgi:voltage-gated potassium channel
MIKKAKARIYELLDATIIESRLERYLNVFLMGLIFINVLAVILETEEALFLRYKNYFHWFEVISVIVFTIEYFLRLWSWTENEHYRHPVFGRLRFVFTPMALIDLLAILPFYLPMFIPFDLRFLRGLRLFRIFRLLKVSRYVKSLRTIKNVFIEKKEELLITVFSVLIMLVFSSSLMYFVEREAQPNKFTSIPAAMWWGIATLTTIGYGDIYPITVLGRFLGSIIAILGIGLFALPAGILASGFAAEIYEKRSEPNVCPHCGKEIITEPKK